MLYIPLILIILFLIYQLLKKKEIEEKELNEYKQKLQQAKNDLQIATTGTDNAIWRLKQIEQNIQSQYEMKKNQMLENLKQDKAVAEIEYEELRKMILSRRNDYENVIEPMRNLEKEKAEKRFYTMSISENDKADIEFLLHEVAPHINHRDIISKLIWQEYIKKPFDEVANRVSLQKGPGIYKLTNINNGMCYVGRSTNVRKRVEDHFKSTIGITSISDQVVHHEILKEGLDNFMIEQVCECTADELNDKEKFYIAFFKATDYGYNKKAGG